MCIRDSLSDGSNLHTFLCAFIKYGLTNDEAWWHEIGWSAVKIVLSMLGKIWIKVILVFKSFPLFLFIIADATITHAARESYSKQFWDTPPCCRGKLGAKIRKLLPSWQALLTYPFVEFWYMLAWHLGLGIPDTERDHAEHYAILSRGGRHKNLSIERLCFESVLVPFLKRHLKQNGRDPRVVNSATMKKKGLLAIKKNAKAGRVCFRMACFFSSRRIRSRG